MPADQPPVRAAIDIGSNTIHIVVARSTPDDLDILADEVDLVRIGESVTATGGISEQKQDEAVAVMRRYKHLAARLDAKDILVVATEAIREANNGGEFLAHIERETGLSTCLIDGDSEAVLTFYGATYETLKTTDPASPLGVMDLGGGSMELITARGSRIGWLTSIPIGSGWLHDRYLPTDPPTSRELAAARSFLQGYLGEMAVPQEPPVLIATGGSANSLLSLAHHANLLDAGSHDLTGDALQQCEMLLTSTPAADIAERYGQSVERARILPAGCLIIQELMSRFHLASIRVSPHGIREGVLLAYARYGKQWLECIQEEARHPKQDEQAYSETSQEDDDLSDAKNLQDEPFIYAGLRLLHEQLDKLLAWQDEVLKQEDNEAVHKMRVASRRLRAILDAYEPCCKPGRFQKVYLEVRQMADLLGAARDTDVMLQHLQERYANAPCEEQAGVAWLIERLQAYRKQQQKALKRFFDSFDEKTFKQRVESCLPKGATRDDSGENTQP